VLNTYVFIFSLFLFSSLYIKIQAKNGSGHGRIWYSLRTMEVGSSLYMNDHRTLSRAFILGAIETRQHSCTGGICIILVSL
jgi:hypothetical protein